MDGGAWWATVPGVAKSQTRLSDFTFTFHLHALEKEMATHSSVFAWRIPWTSPWGGKESDMTENCHMTQQSHCWAYTPRKPELKETSNVHHSTVYNSQDMEATYMSISR